LNGPPFLYRSSSLLATPLPSFQVSFFPAASFSSSTRQIGSLLRAGLLFGRSFTNLNSHVFSQSRPLNSPFPMGNPLFRVDFKLFFSNRAAPVASLCPISALSMRRSADYPSIPLVQSLSLLLSAAPLQRKSFQTI